MKTTVYMDINRIAVIGFINYIILVTLFTSIESQRGTIQHNRHVQQLKEEKN